MLKPKTSIIQAFFLCNKEKNIAKNFDNILKLSNFAAAKIQKPLNEERQNKGSIPRE